MSVLGKGDVDGLRHVEKDVLIPKKMKAKAMILCADYVKEFEDCVRGRTVSAAWHCRQENKKMRACLTSYYKDTKFYEECKQEYLLEKNQFETSGVAPKRMKRTR